jgi:Protein kinase domain
MIYSSCNAGSRLKGLYRGALDREPAWRGLSGRNLRGRLRLVPRAEELLRHDGAPEGFIKGNSLGFEAQPFEPGQSGPQLLTGQYIGAYKILAPLGRGAMGVVYRARDERLRRDVAIKVLPASFANDADRLSRFEQEARATSALNHPNILTIYDRGTHEKAPFIVAVTGDGQRFLINEVVENGAERAAGGGGQLGGGGEEMTPAANQHGSKGNQNKENEQYQDRQKIS